MRTVPLFTCCETKSTRKVALPFDPLVLVEKSSSSSPSSVKRASDVVLAILAQALGRNVFASVERTRLETARATLD